MELTELQTLLNQEFFRIIDSVLVGTHEPSLNHTKVGAETVWYNTSHIHLVQFAIAWWYAIEKKQLTQHIDVPIRTIMRLDFKESNIDTKRLMSDDKSIVTAGFSDYHFITLFYPRETTNVVVMDGGFRPDPYEYDLGSEWQCAGEAMYYIRSPSQLQETKLPSQFMKVDPQEIQQLDNNSCGPRSVSLIINIMLTQSLGKGVRNHNATFDEEFVRKKVNCLFKQAKTVQQDKNVLEFTKGVKIFMQEFENQLQDHDGSYSLRIAKYPEQYLRDMFTYMRARSKQIHKSNSKGKASKVQETLMKQDNQLLKKLDKCENNDNDMTMIISDGHESISESSDDQEKVDYNTKCRWFKNQQISKLKEDLKKFQNLESDYCVKVSELEKESKKFYNFNQQNQTKLEMLTKDYQQQLNKVKQQNANQGLLTVERDQLKLKAEKAQSQLEKIRHIVKALETELKAAKETIAQKNKDELISNNYCKQLKDKISSQKDELQELEQDMKVIMKQRDEEKTKRKDLKVQVSKVNDGKLCKDLNATISMLNGDILKERLKHQEAEEQLKWMFDDAEIKIKEKQEEICRINGILHKEKLERAMVRAKYQKDVDLMQKEMDQMRDELNEATKVQCQEIAQSIDEGMQDDQDTSNSPESDQEENPNEEVKEDWFIKGEDNKYHCRLCKGDKGKLSSLQAFRYHLRNTHDFEIEVQHGRRRQVAGEVQAPKARQAKYMAKIKMEKLKSECIKVFDNLMVQSLKTKAPLSINDVEKLTGSYLDKLIVDIKNNPTYFLYNDHAKQQEITNIMKKNMELTKSMLKDYVEEYWSRINPLKRQKK